MKSKSSYFVFEKVKDETSTPCVYRGTTLTTRSELRKYLDSRLNDGCDARDFLIIRGREEKITAVKIVAEFETVAEPEPIRG